MCRPSGAKPPFLALRAKIVLRCAEGGTNQQAAADLGIDRSTVDRWRARFIAKRLDGLHDEPRSGRPPLILLDRVEEVLVATLESTPGKDKHRSRVSMAKRTGLSKSTIGRISWKRFDLKPHVSSPRSSTSSAYTPARPRRRWCCVSTRRPRYRRWTVRSRCCR
ncbi:helix-turn-helix domain-containing protein [Streptomyces shenzhenensis]|uniref:helix-turn-helix domain-containing protein n=1 Tax=Streptomyces shenzhenensis TaxID=943815 RepID=UPI0037FF529C